MNGFGTRPIKLTDYNATLVTWLFGDEIPPDVLSTLNLLDRFGETARRAGYPWRAGQLAWQRHQELRLFAARHLAAAPVQERETALQAISALAEALGLVPGIAITPAMLDGVQNEAGVTIRHLHSTDLHGCDVTALDFTGYCLWRTNLDGANLRGVDFTGAHARSATFRNADHTDSTIHLADRLDGADVTGAIGLTDSQIAILLTKGAILEGVSA